MTSGVYGLYSKAKGECLYVGMSTNIEKRWEKYHLPRLKAKTHLRKDFSEWFHAQENPDNSIEVRVLEQCEDVNLLNALEHSWFLKEKPRFYGKMPSKNEQWKYSPSARQVLSEAMVKSNALKAPLGRGRGNRTLVEKTCEGCGTTFLTVEKRQKCCSRACIGKRYHRGSTK